MTVDVKEFIEHHGVKGMRWGVRRSRSRVSKAGGGKPKPSSKPSTERTKFEKSPSRLSDAELSRRVKRLEIERRYNELNKKDATEGKKFASDILKTSGKTVATTLLAGAALYGISRALGTKMNPSAVTAITGKKGVAGVGGGLRTPLPPPLPGTRKG